jgi:hypothetical protein
VSIAIVTLAGAIEQLVVLLLIGLSAAAVAVAERCQLWPRGGLVLLDIGDSCSRAAHRMLRGESGQ